MTSTHDRNAFEEMLTGGHPNSLGQTVAVVDLVRADKRRLEALYQCHSSQDPTVRLRVSNAMKRIGREHPDWLVPYVDRLLNDVAEIDQPSARWTLAQLLLWLDGDLTPVQRTRAVMVLRRNLERSDDWIVQNSTMSTLGAWALEDLSLRAWLLPHLERLAVSARKSAARRAQQVLADLRSAA